MHASPNEPMPSAPVRIALTVDVDPDANCAVPGRTGAVSRGGKDGEVRLDACRRGLDALLDIVDNLGLPAAFFWEGRSLRSICRANPELTTRIRTEPRHEHGCHGWEHEDFAGTVSGLPLDREAAREVLAKNMRAVEDVFGTVPQGFRAPYCRMTPALAAALGDTGFRYDASVTQALGTRTLIPHVLPGSAGVYELPLVRGTDGSGCPISAYLWQLMEGRRSVGDYVNLAQQIAVTGRGGLAQVALHPWHLFVSERGSPLSQSGTEDLAHLLAELCSIGDFTTPGRYLKSWQADP